MEYWLEPPMDRPSRIRGFMPDIYRSLGKYGLTSVLMEYLAHSTFPSSASWRKLVKQTMTHAGEKLIFSMIESNPVKSNFKYNHCEFIPCSYGTSVKYIVAS